MRRGHAMSKSKQGHAHAVFVLFTLLGEVLGWCRAEVKGVRQAVG